MTNTSIQTSVSEEQAAAFFWNDLQTVSKQHKQNKLKYYNRKFCLFRYHKVSSQELVQ